MNTAGLPDPDEMLEAQRDGISDWEKAPDWGPVEREAAERATSAAAALDHWMTHQGRLPVAWLEGRAELPPPVPAHVTPIAITDDIALNMAAGVLDAYGDHRTAQKLRAMLPETEGRIGGKVYQEAVGKWGRIYPVTNLLGDDVARLPKEDPKESGESS
jgi:hypothetical protein